MIEKTVLDYLTSGMTVPAYMEKPANAPGRFIVVQRTGGGKENYICSGMMTVQSYAPTLYEAALLNESAKELMLQAAELPEICGIRLNSDYPFPDPDTKQYRYQAVFDITHY